VTSSWDDDGSWAEETDHVATNRAEFRAQAEAHFENAPDPSLGSRLGFFGIVAAAVLVGFAALDLPGALTWLRYGAAGCFFFAAAYLLYSFAARLRHDRRKESK
jgi:hypothetical protein